MFVILFKEKKMTNTTELVRIFSDLAQLARKEGLLALESKINEVDDRF